LALSAQATVNRVLVGGLLLALAWCQPLVAVEIPSRLMPEAKVLDSLRRSGLIGGDVEPVPAFTWVLERQRPGRSARQSEEAFSGSPSGQLAGLALMVRTHLPRRGPEAGRTRLSVRGLATVDHDDDDVAVEVEGLALPLREDARFSLRLNDGDAVLEQHCRVGASRPAAGLHPALPGMARAIECNGRGSYRGIPVRVEATVHYLEKLGVFLRAESVLHSPLGPFRSTIRITSFSMP
jgi:hypothetical protein